MGWLYTLYIRGAVRRDDSGRVTASGLPGGNPLHLSGKLWPVVAGPAAESGTTAGHYGGNHAFL